MTNKRNTASTTVLEINPCRRVGAPAFMKPARGDFGITFTVCDQRGANSHPRFVTLYPGWTFDKAMSVAVFKWDIFETSRVTAYNISLAVYWARSWLLFFLQAQTDVKGVNVPEPSRADFLINFDDPVKLVLCKENLREMVTLYTECVKTTGAWAGNGRSTLVSLI